MSVCNSKRTEACGDSDRCDGDRLLLAWGSAECVLESAITVSQTPMPNGRTGTSHRSAPESVCQFVIANEQRPAVTATGVTAIDCFWPGEALNAYWNRRSLCHRRLCRTEGPARRTVVLRNPYVSL